MEAALAASHEKNPGIPRVDCVRRPEARRTDGDEGATRVARPSAWPCRAPSLGRPRPHGPTLFNQPFPGPETPILEPGRHTLPGVARGHRDHLEQPPRSSLSQTGQGAYRRRDHRETAAQYG